MIDEKAALEQIRKLMPTAGDNDNELMGFVIDDDPASDDFRAGMRRGLGWAVYIVQQLARQSA